MPMSHNRTLNILYLESLREAAQHDVQVAARQYGVPVRVAESLSGMTDDQIYRIATRTRLLYQAIGVDFTEPDDDVSRLAGMFRDENGGVQA